MALVHGFDPPERFVNAEETPLEQGGRCILHPCGEGEAAAVAAKVHGNDKEVLRYAARDR